MQEEHVKEYQLSGGGTVKVYKPFGDGVYFAIVEMDGVYPEEGKVAQNIGREEYSVVLDGEFEYEIAGAKKMFKKGDAVLVGDGVKYKITGKGRDLVFVKDVPGGKTEILED